MSTTAVLLVGGRGTRLSSVAPQVPKCLVRISGSPLLRWQLEWVARQGLFAEAILAVGWLGNAVEDFVASGEWPVRIRVRHDGPEQRGTGGAAKNALAVVETEWAVLLNGDTLFRADVGMAMNLTETKQWAGAIGIGQRTRNDSGAVMLDAEGQVAAFVERGQGRWSSAGMYLLPRSALAREPDRFSLEYDWLPRFVAAHRVGTFPVAFHDVGTPERLAAAEGWFCDDYTQSGPVTD